MNAERARVASTSKVCGVRMRSSGGGNGRIWSHGVRHFRGLSAFVDSFPSQSECCSWCVSGYGRISIVPAISLLGEKSLEHAEELGTTGTSSRPNSVVGLSLYLVGTPRLILTPVVREPGSEVDTDAVEWDALVSVWWDHTPGEGAQ